MICSTFANSIFASFTPVKEETETYQLERSNNHSNYYATIERLSLK